MNNARIAEVLDLVADLLEFQDANPFRVRAYRNGARTIRDLSRTDAGDRRRSRPQADRHCRASARTWPRRSPRLCATGTLPMLEELQAQVPQSVLALLRIPGMGPKKAAALYQRAEDHDARRTARRLRGPPGPRAQGFRRQDRGDDSGRHGTGATPPTSGMTVGRCRQTTRKPFESIWLEQCDAVEQLEVAGSYRRGKDTIGDLDFLVVASDIERGDGSLRGAARGRRCGHRPRTDENVRFALAAGLQVDLRVVPAEAFGAALQYFTGSKDHNIVLRGLAKDRGLKINEYGVLRRPTATKLRSPAAPRRTSTPRSTCPGFRPSCARRGASSSGPTPAHCPS